ncbi:ribonuclease D [Paramagnetospirillum magneticum]|uniref:Ribonuclease D n=1 Tax=Paramagnetospirillum magneticum (strain ATCC 700264 / AMB-1) TaxID=342108 RepID=Q2W089_PARM1|nr:ribonuclease H-like domain-containing protein [Paramagnetospirillum magneticum]BAE52736.1 Ribonuclease D [Paramagnetospirillum magneticum AMB-1]
MTVFYHKNDLPDGLDLGNLVAIDSETMGLNLQRDRLCVVQLSAGDGHAHVVHYPKPEWNSPNLVRMLADSKVTKLFHFARFDVAMIRRYLGVRCTPVFCTKIASKLTRTNTEGHSLKVLCKEFLNIDLSKLQQSSDWGAPELTADQLAYAASDVLYLHQLKDRLDALLDREGRRALAEACFAFLPDRAELDLAGWDAEDIFSH